ncbi:MAG: DUF4164 domain-containing protein [Pseudomonadota bacterium]
MSADNQLSMAVYRLNDALVDLEKAVGVVLEREESLRDAEAEVQRMGADRARLAEAFDQAQERSHQLSHVNNEVSRRLVDAMESIRNVIDRKQDV